MPISQFNLAVVLFCIWRPSNQATPSILLVMVPTQSNSCMLFTPFNQIRLSYQPSDRKIYVVYHFNQPSDKRRVLLILSMPSRTKCKAFTQPPCGTSFTSCHQRPVVHMLTLECGSCWSICRTETSSSRSWKNHPLVVSHLLLSFLFCGGYLFLQ